MVTVFLQIKWVALAAYGNLPLLSVRLVLTTIFVSSGLLHSLSILLIFYERVKKNNLVSVCGGFPCLFFFFISLSFYCRPLHIEIGFGGLCCLIWLLIQLEYCRIIDYPPGRHSRRKLRLRPSRIKLDTRSASNKTVKLNPAHYIVQYWRAPPPLGLNLVGNDLLLL